MKYLFINSSTNYEPRVDLFARCLREEGHEVRVFASDFDHAKKCRREVRGPEKPGYERVGTLPYRKNLSLARILSHAAFSGAVFRKIKDMDADVVWVVVPPNSNAPVGRKYRKKHPGAKIVLDVVDLWPESLPVGLPAAAVPALSGWKALRNKSLREADGVVLECEYYREVLGQGIEGLPAVVIPWMKEDSLPTGENRKERETESPGRGDSPLTGENREDRKTDDVKEEKQEQKQEQKQNREQEREQEQKQDQDQEQDQDQKQELRLLYLGAVNNIVDLELTEALIRIASSVYPVRLDIIGLGEKKEELAARARRAGAYVTDHGAVYDEQEKFRIMRSCSFGLNVMKERVQVGLSMKSIDYLSCGLPLINSLGGDIRRIVEEDCGINIDREDIGSGGQGFLEALEEWIGSGKENTISRERIRALYRARYSSANASGYLKEVQKLLEKKREKR